MTLFNKHIPKKRMKFIDFNIRYCKNKWQYSTYSKLFLFAIRGCGTSLKKVMSSLIVKRYSEFQKPSISFKGSKSAKIRGRAKPFSWKCVLLHENNNLFPNERFSIVLNKKTCLRQLEKGVNMQWLLKYVNNIIAYCVARPVLSCFVTFCMRRKGNFQF